ncbi:hypothetical protein RFI_29532 [Reticulomyxa filosa]|uniref:Uncharacterized protein n=1 Tax=Reticulomyxa filosa TaxID=46433 RepID=X6M135_RETFI|nr:hypothetical protein RFI_29532 [Reticulomyxa filosa]|eukprot:ETO07858.1 hypothetical protein RFI_29532 [Reticulomyxa filosa]
MGNRNVDLSANNTLSATVSSFGDITGDELVAKSVVFHCANNAKPAFCAPFITGVGVFIIIIIYCCYLFEKRDYFTQKNPFKLKLFFFGSFFCLDGYVLKADFSTAPGVNTQGNAYISLEGTFFLKKKLHILCFVIIFFVKKKSYAGQVQYQFDTYVFGGSDNCPGDLVNIWIGDAWTDGVNTAHSTQCSSSMYGTFYDPTNQCYAEVNKTDCMFCKSGGKFCGNSGYQYMTDLGHLLHKSAVLVCASTGKPLYCAKLQNVGVGIAQAKFADATGAQGVVVVRDGQVGINVDFSQAKANYLGTKVPTTCFDQGLKAHIHEHWNYESTTDQVGYTACDKSATGGHWDPWAACSTTTSYTAICKLTPSPSPTSACISVGGTVGNGKYICNTTNYAQDPFACEIGDWSGKYGKYVLGSDSRVSRSDHSPWEVDATELVGRSIVFHCADDNTRAFCAPFTLLNNTDGDDTKPTWSQSTQSGNTIEQASISSSWGSIVLTSTGHYLINANFSKYPCAARIGYGVFEG